MLKEYDVIALKRKVPETPLPPGSEGTIVIDHKSEPPAFMVEFLDSDGHTIGLDTIFGEDLVLLIPYSPDLFLISETTNKNPMQARVHWHGICHRQYRYAPAKTESDRN